VPDVIKEHRCSYPADITRDDSRLMAALSRRLLLRIFNSHPVKIRLKDVRRVGPQQGCYVFFIEETVILSPSHVYEECTSRQENALIKREKYVELSAVYYLFLHHRLFELFSELVQAQPTIRKRSISFYNSLKPTPCAEKRASSIMHAPTEPRRTKSTGASVSIDAS